MGVDKLLIEQKIKEIAAAAGADMVECSFFPSAAGTTVRCIVDMPGGGISLDRCSDINRAVCLYLDQAKAFNGDYSVEVNSPGLDRKLKTPADFKRVAGKMVMLWLDAAAGGKSYLEGEVIAADNIRLRLKIKGEEHDIMFDRIKTGKEKIIF